MKLRFLLIALFFVTLGFAQNKGTITGTITDKDMGNETLPFASVLVKGTKIAVNADENGNYSITANEGPQTLIFAFLGYHNAEVQVTVKANQTITVNKALESTSVQLQDVVIEKIVSREKESALIAEQQNAIEMKQAIGAQELSRKGISDAAAAVVKTSGVSKSDDVNNVFVRGLGDRYNSTTLNGLPLPSEDPVYKNISLEFFGSSIIKNININKTFSADIYGDNAGANIDISSKEVDKRSYLNAGVGTGYNTNAIGAGNFLVADGAYNYFGFLENGKDIPLTNLKSYDFKTSFNPVQKNNLINSSFNIAGGGKFDLGGEKSLSVFATVQSSSDFTYKHGQARQVNPQGGAGMDMNFEKSEYKATQSALGNVKYKFGNQRSISYNTLFIHDNNQSVGDYRGFAKNINDNNDANNSLIRRQQLNNNNLFVNQLLGEYRFTDKIKANAGVTYNTIRSSQPDRRTNSYDYDYNGTNGNGYTVASNSAGLNNRWYSTLEENDVAGKIEGEYTFNPESNLKKVLTAGFNMRSTDRTFDFTQINYDFNNPVPVNPNNPDAVFNQENLTLGKNNGGFDLVTTRGKNANALDPFYYLADRQIYAGFAQMVYPFSENLTVQAGVRYEKVSQKIDWDTNLSSSVNNLAIDPSTIDKDYFLPSLNLKYSLNEKNAIRFAASQTYTMPQFKETAAFLYEDVNISEMGNPNLLPSTDYNVDLKYDWYMSDNEIISIGGLYKYIKDPISRMRILSAANDLSYVNTDKAFVAGAELEVRKNIFRLGSDTRKKDLTFGLNASYLYTEQVQNDVDTDKFTVQFTHDKGKMQGASPLLINTDLSYNVSDDKTALLSTLVFSYFADKVYSVGTNSNENIIEKSVPTLDFINKFDIKDKKLQLSLGVKNLLNPRYRLTQDTTINGVPTESIISNYRKGMFVSFGLNWTL
ncbi:TonB-dependent receptor [Flavobacterium sp. AG291]|uniref:TonB-dependent receptor n=1 Tax=Flavobacterium sp. AG291 TaxID=2184000 RepID=UPI000E0A0ADC|nr:TonB-dependent receptor [Flavobacterium sp. AG291]RDI15741.1 TonB-dependent receptor [Flavobacterium sp. AG291]